MSEQYEEIVFCNPGERFRRQLMTYVAKDATGSSMLSPVHSFGAKFRVWLILLTSFRLAQDGSALLGPVFDDSLDVERLGGIQQHIEADIEGMHATLSALY